MKRWAAALGLLLALAAPARAAPALFVVRGGAAPLYLLGSIHILEPGVQWQGPRLQQVLQEVRQCWFEVTGVRVTPSTVVQAMQVVSFNQPLRTLLSPGNHARLMEQLAGLDPGLAGAVEYTAPWLASIILFAAKLNGTVGDTDPGVDIQLIEQCRRQGKTLGSLESLTEVLAVLNAIPLDGQLRMLVSLLDQAPVDLTTFRAMQATWLEGDLENLAALLGGFGRAMPELSDALIRGRNRLWLAPMQQLLRQQDPVLLTVGAAHLTGPGNIRELLAGQGYTIDRLQ